MSSIAGSEKEWTTFKSKESTIFRGFVFSPSGRWAVDPKKEADGLNAVYIIDMATLSSKKYEIRKHNYLKRIIDVYWISESELVLVDYNVTEKNFNQIYCHLVHEERWIVPFFRDNWQLPSNAETRFRVPGFRGANPVNFKGKQFHMIQRGSNLIFVRWNKFYADEDNEIFQITLPTLWIGTQYETFELAFSHDSTIFMPVVEKLNHSANCNCHRHAVDRLIRIDLNKIDFIDGCADLAQNCQAIDAVSLKVLQKRKLRQTSAPVKYSQVGDYLLAYTIDKKESTPDEERTRRIFMINLRDLTIGYNKVMTGRHYFPTVYRNQLMVVRNDVTKDQEDIESSSSKFMIKALVKTEVSSLTELAQAANVRLNTTASDPVLIPFVFPRGHCCSRQECFCQGILKTEYAEKNYARENIECAMEDSDDEN